MGKLKLILIVGFFHQIVIQGLRPIIPLLAYEIGASKVEIGLIAATFAIFPMLLAIRAGAWIDIWGVKRPIIIGSIGVVIGVIIPFFAPSIASLFISQALTGISQVFINIALQNYVGLSSTLKERDKAFGWFNFCTSAGQFVGPVLIGISADITNFSTAFLFASFVAIIPIATGFFMKDILVDSNDEKTKKKNKKAYSSKQAIQILSIRGMKKALVSGMLALFTRDVILTYFPLYASGKGISTKEIGLILGFVGAASMVIRLFQHPILTKLKRKMVLFISLSLAGFAFAFVPITDTVILFSLLSILIGLGLGLAQPLSMVAVVNLSPPRQSGQALGVRITGHRLTQVVSPIIFGAIAQLTGIIYIFWICSGVLISGGLYYLKGKEISNKENHD